MTLPTKKFVFIMPWLFVWIWSTGFLTAKFGQPYAEPFTLLSIRFILSLLVLSLLIPLFKTSLIFDKFHIFHSALVGVLIHGIYLGGVFQAIALGMNAGVSSIVIGLQPLVMAMMAGMMLKEKVTGKQWLGLVAGLIGLYMVLSESFATGSDTIFAGFSSWAVVLVICALLGISIGSVYQKRYSLGINLLSSIWWQYFFALIACAVIAFTFETREIDWQWGFIVSLSWQVLALSVGAILLLMIMINMGKSARVASLFYLVPPTVAVQAWILFGETMGLMALVGLLVIAFGVAMARGT